MNSLMLDCASVLSDAGFTVDPAEVPATESTSALEVLKFEDATVLGFVVGYGTPAELIDRWKVDGNRIAMRHRSELQSAQAKAWNAYLVLISEGAADVGQSLILGQIEEDLEAMRKITKAGVTNATGARAALLPLLPFRAAPSLDPIDMRGEITQRSSELDPEVVQAFLSGADESLVLQLLEDKE